MLNKTSHIISHGTILNKEGMKPDPEKIQEIKEMPPLGVQQLHPFGVN